MAVGDTNDMAVRIAAVLPARWFPALSQAPILNALLQGIATAWSYCFSLLAFTRLQARLSTSSGVLIDIWANGWFGTGSFPRLSGEGDAAYIARIQASLFITRGTMPSVIAAAQEAAPGATIRSIEPWNPNQVGWVDGSYVDVDTVAVPNRVGGPAPYFGIIELSMSGTDTIDIPAVCAAINATMAYGTRIWVRDVSEGET